MAYLLNVLTVDQLTDTDVEIALRGRPEWVTAGTLADDGVWIARAQDTERGSFHISTPLPVDADEWSFDNHNWKQVLAEHQLHVPRWDIELEIPHWASEGEVRYALDLARHFAREGSGFVFDPVERVMLTEDDGPQDLAVFMELLVLTRTQPSDEAVRRLAPLTAGWRLEGTLSDENGIEMLRGSDDDPDGAVVSVEAPEEPDVTLVDELNELVGGAEPAWSTRIVCSYAFGTDDGGRRLALELARRLAASHEGYVYDTDDDAVIEPVVG